MKEVFFTIKKIVKLISFLSLVSILSINCVWCEDKKCLVIVLSSDLYPYMEASEAIKKSIDKKNFDVYSLIFKDNEDHVKRWLLSKKCEFVVTVGTAASKSVGDLPINGIKKVFCLVLYPFINNLYDKFSCGVYMDIPPEVIFNALLKYCSKPVVGVVYSSDKLIPYLKSLEAKAVSVGIPFKKKKISSVYNLREIFSEFWSEINVLLFIPDPIFSSESVIKHMIIKALQDGKFVIGYNKFFEKSGAALTITIDYKATGEKTADLLVSLMEKGKCAFVPSVYEISVNEKVLKVVGEK